MARARNIKPGFFTNDKLVELPFEYRLLFIGLWTIADKEGRLLDRPKKIRIEIFPADNVDCEKGLKLLANAGFITRYEAAGMQLIQINNWGKHQSPHIRESASELPPPAEGTIKVVPEHNLGSAEALPRSPDSGFSDSGFLIPEVDPSGLVGQEPDAQPPHAAKPKNGSHYNPLAREVLDFLNAKAGRSYQPVDANLKLIVARLKEGASVQDCRAVIAKKCREWGSDEKMAEYLRPATLFNALKFGQYRGELVEVP